jgi:hypothetical protein
MIASSAVIAACSTSGLLAPTNEAGADGSALNSDAGPGPDGSALDATLPPSLDAGALDAADGAAYDAWPDAGNAHDAGDAQPPWPFPTSGPVESTSCRGDFDCDKGYVCLDDVNDVAPGTCRRTYPDCVTNGDPCGAGYVCVDDTWSIGGQTVHRSYCAHQGGADGGTCDPRAGCTGALFCHATGTAPYHECIPSLPAGSADCGAYPHGEFPCAAGLTCTAFGTGTPTCTTPRALGGACTDDWDCGQGAFCSSVTQQCEKSHALGETCVAKVETPGYPVCQAHLTCTAGKCQVAH